MNLSVIMLNLLRLGATLTIFLCDTLVIWWVLALIHWSKPCLFSFRRKWVKGEYKNVYEFIWDINH